MNNSVNAIFRALPITRERGTKLEERGGGTGKCVCVWGGGVGGGGGYIQGDYILCPIRGCS